MKKWQNIMHIALPLILNERGDRDVPSMNSWHNMSYSEGGGSERESKREIGQEREEERER